MHHYLYYKGTNATIYCGVRGVLEWNDKFGKKRPVFLSLQLQVPVPKVFYMIVVPEKLPPFVIVGINNPYLKDITEDYMFTDKPMKLPFDPHWKKDNSNGIMYASSLTDFYNHQPKKPDYSSWASDISSFNINFDYIDTMYSALPKINCTTLYRACD